MPNLLDPRVDIFAPVPAIGWADLGLVTKVVPS